MQQPDHKSDLLRAAVTRWFELVSASGIPPAVAVFRVAEILAAHPSWVPVRDAVQAITDPVRRPDLYKQAGDEALQPAFSDRAVMMESGLAAAARAACAGERLEPEAVAEEFVAFCTAAAPIPEDWLLLDGTFPADTQVTVGEFTLQSFTTTQLRCLRARGLLGRHVQSDLDDALLDGASFLRRPRQDNRPIPTFPMPLLHSRPEVLFCRPLITLSLWSSEPLHMSAVFAVEAGRKALRTAGDIETIETTDDGTTEYLRRETGAYRVTADQAEAFTAFCARIGTLVDTLITERTPGKKPKPSARALRLERAAEHLVRASHRTFGHDFVWEEEADETVLHYVIAMEALLSDRSAGGELTRKVEQRAAGLFLTDASRLNVARIVKNAYGLRSDYAHGSPTTPLNRPQLDELRRVAHQVLLRWLLIAPGEDKFGAFMDETLLSEEKRRSVVHEPLRAFFADTPPARLPEDIVASAA